jgi:aspartyl-tRNA synthetase
LHPYRTHTCGELRKDHLETQVRLSGWVHRKRDHGHLLFIDLRDHYGVTQVVVGPDEPFFVQATHVKPESVITVTGVVVARAADTVNSKLSTGEVELRASTFVLESPSETLPFLVADPNPVDEAIRLSYRFLDLRREQLHANVLLRARVISSMRRRMTDMGFTEFQTPILTASSPEGARDFIVPSRLHPGKFYALPQAPQQFKQLLMVSGFDRYFQIAPCFRDEDARADRSPGEFYQLDIEMSFVTQEDVFAKLEGLLIPLFREFSAWKTADGPFPRIPFREAILKYGTDKPDLRNPLQYIDATAMVGAMNLPPFKEAIREGGVGRLLVVNGASERSRKFFQELEDFMKRQGAPGLGYVTFKNGEAKGPLLKFMDAALQGELKSVPGLDPGDSVAFFLVGGADEVADWAHALRTRLGTDLELVKAGEFRFCWIVDFPMYERNPDTGAIEFSHNPFSMPQGGMEALERKDPLDILAYQYDIVCNGVELSSGAIRNHRPDIMLRAFALAGYGPEVVERKFGGMLNAFRFGAPPHGGIAPGVDRIVMLLADQPNLREVIAFPMNASAEDLLMGAPGEVSPKQLQEVHIKVEYPKGFKEEA